MFVELIDQLRCPAAHEETWLVLFADESRDRHILRGTLGCPVCGRRYPIVNGTVWFRPPERDAPPGHDGSASTTAGAGAPAGAADAERTDWPTRLAAFLGLGDVRGVAALYGSWAAHAEALGDLVDGVELLAVAPGEATHPMLSTLEPSSSAAIPLATGALQAAALPAGASDADAAEAARLLRAGGRLLAPAATPLPHAVVELARDADWWVGERDRGPSGIVTIGRARRNGAG